MKYSKTSPVGIDKSIQAIQNSLYNFCQSKWSLSEAQILSFGRVYKIGNKFRWYKSGKDYEEFDMLLDDRYAFQSFFIVNSVEWSQINVMFNSNVDLCIFSNVSTLKPLISHRADEEIRMETYTRFKPAEWFGGISDLTIEGYTHEMDMQPYHSFKMILNLRYQ
jgi:hypothetical protein